MESSLVEDRNNVEVSVKNIQEALQEYKETPESLRHLTDIDVGELEKMLNKDF